MKGAYVIISQVDEERAIKVGKLGEIFFKKGYYAYVGSAMNGIEARIRRHLRQEKKLRWHIDYLLQHATIKKIFYTTTLKECSIAHHFAKKFAGISRFGSSDCRCRSHLFYSPSINEMVSLVEKIGMKSIIF